MNNSEVCNIAKSEMALKEIMCEGCDNQVLKLPCKVCQSGSLYNDEGLKDDSSDLVEDQVSDQDIEAFEVYYQEEVESQLPGDAEVTYETEEESGNDKK